MRFEQPFANHNCGHLTFNPLASPGSADFGLLYLGFADGGSGGDPFKHAQNLNSAFGKILRIDRLGSNSANGKYGIPAANPFANDGNDRTLGEIYAYGGCRGTEGNQQQTRMVHVIASAGKRHASMQSRGTCSSTFMWVI